MSSPSWQADLGAAQRALEAGEWSDALDGFGRATAAAGERAEAAEAWEGLGLVHTWLENGPDAVSALEAAYRGYRRRGDLAEAARIAALLAESTFTFDGKRAVSRGWERRATTLLREPVTDADDVRVLHLAETAYLALLRDHDVGRAGESALRSAELAASVGLADLELHGRALGALAAVFDGAVDDGMTTLDECAAAATAGEISDPTLAGTVCCYLIFACEWTLDLDRARDWCEHLLRLSEHWRMGGLHGLCRTHYGSVLMEMGSLDSAEPELLAGLEELSSRRPGLAPEAWVRLAELRRRQGRYDDAAAALDRAGDHPLVLARRARLALDRGEAEVARRLADQALSLEPPLPPSERVRASETLAAARPPAEVEDGAIEGLTRRELDVVRLIGEGRSNEEIARALSLSRRTVERHIANLYRKLDARGPAARAQVTAFAVRHRL